MSAAPPTTRPRLGFLGAGWIGRHRLSAIAGSDAGEIAAVADPAVAADDVGLEPLASLDELLERDLDGVVIATPSALHAEQAIACLDHGLAVFCQKPLGRTAEETRRVVEAAREADRLLGVDLSYRFVNGMPQMRELVLGGEIGDVYAADLVFHNAYGPDKPWFYDRRLSGGGCVIDLGIHLVDLALWTLGWPRVEEVASRLFSNAGHGLEDHAVAQLDLAGRAVARLACSWGAHAGRDCVFEASFYGTSGAVTLENVGGSFYDFRAELRRGTASTTLAEPPDEWGGRAAVDWARRLGRGERFDPEAERLVEVARTIDRIYGSAR